MAVHESDNSSENQPQAENAPDESVSESTESLFIRSTDDTLSARKDSISEKPAVESEKASGDSLFHAVMKEKSPAKNDVHTKESKEKIVQNNSKDENSILGNFELVGAKELNASDAKGHPEKSAESDASKAKVVSELTNKITDALEESAYKSAVAAMITVASKLASDTVLANMITDRDGNVSKHSVDNVMKLDAGQKVHNLDKKVPGPILLSEDQRKSLDTVRTHIGLAASFSGGQSILAGAEFSSKSASKIGNEIANEISKEVKNALGSGDNFKKLDSGKLDEISKKIIDNLSEKIKEGILGGDEGRAAGANGARIAKPAAPGDQPSKDQPSKDQPSKRKEPEQASEQAKEQAKDQAKDQAEVQAGLAAEQAEAALEQQPRVDVPQLKDSEFVDVAKQLLKKLDSNKNGELTKDEIVKALQDPSIKGKEAQALAAMYQNFDRLHNLSKHEGWFSSKSITAADLDKYNEVKTAQDARVNEAFAMKTWAHKNLEKFDSNKSGSLTKDELDRAINDPKTSSYDKSMLEAVKKNYSNMGHFYESGVNLKAFDNHAAGIFKDTDEAKLVSGVWASTYNVSEGQKANVSHDLYGDKNDPLKSINPDAIKQGSIGNCYFLASLAAVAKSNPESIKNMIKDNGDGTYTVTFPGAKDEPITVKAPTQAEQGLYNHGSPNGTWASVMEKAYGEYCQKHFYRRSPFNLGGGDTPAEGADGGGRTGSVTELLTGNSSDTDMLIVTSQATTAAKLEKAFSGNPPKAVTAGINKGILSDYTDDKFFTGHAYSIVGFEPDGKGGGTVTVRNPWGGANNSTSGTIKISLEKFMKNFSDINYEQ